MVPKPSLPFLQKDKQPRLPAKWYNNHDKGVAIAEILTEKLPQSYQPLFLPNI